MVILYNLTEKLKYQGINVRNKKDLFKQKTILARINISINWPRSNSGSILESDLESHDDLRQPSRRICENNRIV